MLRGIHAHLRGNAVAYLALFLALGGGSYAVAANTIGASDIRTNAVGSSEIRANAVGSPEVRASAIGPSELRTGSVLSGEVRDGTLGDVDVRDGGLSAKDLGAGQIARGFFGSSIPSGVTLKGVWGGFFAAAGGFVLQNISFPIPTTTPLTSSAVNFGPTTGASDADATCTGTFVAPTAPAGKVCLYVRPGTTQNATGFSGFAMDTDGSQANRLGFAVTWQTNPATAGTRADGSWAYTAP
jgi:hypothetical protein